MQVRDGRLTPEEAAERLERLSVDATETEPESPQQPEGAVRRVKIIGDFRSCKISGDASVAGAVADGEHSARQEGDTLIIDARVNADGREGDFTFGKGERDGPRVVIGFRPTSKPVSVRMNPSLPLEVAIDAGSASITGVRAPIDAHVDAGSIKVDGATAPLNLSVDAGSITVAGIFERGESRVTTDAGAVRVKLARGSSVHVRARTDIGKITLGGQSERGLRIGGSEREAVFGSGQAKLDIRTGIGKIAVEEV